MEHLRKLEMKLITHWQQFKRKLTQTARLIEQVHSTIVKNGRGPLCPRRKPEKQTVTSRDWYVPELAALLAQAIWRIGIS